MILKREDVIEYALTFPGAYLDTPFRDPNVQLIRVRGIKKSFLLIFERDGLVALNVKTDPVKARLLRQTFPSVLPAYRQNKEH